MVELILVIIYGDNSEKHRQINRLTLLLALEMGGGLSPIRSFLLPELPSSEGQKRPFTLAGKYIDEPFRQLRRSFCGLDVPIQQIRERKMLGHLKLQSIIWASKLDKAEAFYRHVLGLRSTRRLKSRLVS